MKYEELSERLIEERKKNKITQMQLADKIEMNYQVISRAENSRKPMTMQFAERYATGLGLQLSIRIINPQTGEVIE